MTYLRDICQVVVIVALVGSAVHHVVSSRRFRTEVMAQRTVASRWVWPATAAVTLVETGLGATLGAIALGVIDDQGVGRVVPVLSAVLFAAYAGYTTVLMRLRPGAPCACGSSGRPASLWTVLRAAALSAVSLASVGAGGLSTNTATETAQVFAIALTCTIAIWLVPDALHVPGWTGGADKYAGLRS